MLHVSRPNEGQKSPEVLVLDDDLDILVTSVALLKLGKIEATGVQTLAEALAVLAKWPIRVVVLDLIVPMTSDLEMFRAIRGGYPEMPIIVSTGVGLGNIKPEILCDENTSFLGKPYTGEELRQVVDSVWASNKQEQMVLSQNGDHQPSNIITTAFPQKENIG